jgi:hypothetical protein
LKANQPVPRCVERRAKGIEIGQPVGVLGDHLAINTALLQASLPQASTNRR